MRAIARWVAVLVLLAVLSLPLVAGASVASLTLYNYNNTGADGNGTDIYASNWNSQSFNVTAPYEVQMIRLPLVRVGSPGLVTVSIYNAVLDGASYEPTGWSLTYVNLDADLYIPTTATGSWIEFDIPDIMLEADAQYCIVVSVPYSGTSANYIHWAWDSGGSATSTNLNNSYSTNGGGSWTSGTSDYLFEVWGEPTLLIKNVEVFEDYYETGDMLFCLEYLNIAPPYYEDSGDIEQYFRVRLLSTDGLDVLASTVPRFWGDKPASIYLNADQASSLEEGSQYYLQLIANYGSQAYDSYQLQTADWRGTNLDFLESWCIRVANSMETYDGKADGTYTTFIVDKGEVLTEQAGSWFDTAIPLLSRVVPDIFQVTTSPIPYPTTTPNNAMADAQDWETAMGTDFKTSMEQIANLLGIESKQSAAIVGIGVFGAVAVACAMLGSLQFGIVLGLPVLMIGGWAGFISLPAIAILGVAYAVLFAWAFWWKPT